MASTEASIKFVFQTPYRGGTKTWSTTFHVTGGNWQDQAHFNTFSDNLWTDLKAVTSTRTTLVSTVGYDAGSSVPVFQKAYAQAGTQALAGVAYAALEMCYLLRFTTTQKSSKNHPIYLFNYIHDSMIAGASSPDTPHASMVTAWNARCNLLIAGYSDGSLTRKRCGPRGAVAQTGAVEQYLHHRDFPA